MRSAIILIAGIVLSSFAAGMLALSVHAPEKPQVSHGSVGAIKRRLMVKLAGQVEARVPSIDAYRERRELLDPSSVLPRTVEYPRDALVALKRYADTCAGGVPKRVPNGLKKAWKWQAFACGATRTLPSTFFETGPLIHPSGSSYARLARLSGRPPYTSPEWSGAHIGLFHVSERAELPRELLSEADVALSRLGSSGLQAYLEGADLVVGADQVFLRSSTREEAGDYLVFPFTALHAFASRRHFVVAEAGGSENCPVRDGNACWSYDLTRETQNVERSSLVLATLVFLLSIGASVLLVRQLERRRRQETRRRFALSALSHELRTPVASLVLHTAHLREGFDRLDEGAQRALLAVVDETQRLRRLVETTSQYLPAISGEKMHLERKPIPSARNLVESALHSVPRGDAISIEGGDFSLHGDPYWLGVAVANLVRNALAHGAEPVAVRLRAKKGFHEIEVRDSGRCGYRKLSEMTAPFEKDGRSSGLGLGLFIVSEIIRESGGRLRFDRSPTRFTLVFPTHAEEKR